MKNRKYLIGSISVGIITSLALVIPAFAATPGNQPVGGWGGAASGNHMQGRGQMMGRPAVSGIVESVSGTTLTITSRGFGKNTATTTYSVDASNAVVMKNNATSSVSNIAIGDRAMVQGTVSGTNVVATKIFDGVPGMVGQKGDQNMQITGNGEPVIAGKVSAINGTTVTMTNSGNTTYTIDVSSAKITRPGATSTSVSSIAVGDTVMVQGTVNGTLIIASSVIDQTNTSSNQGHRGFFGSIGSFFSHLFGF